MRFLQIYFLMELALSFFPPTASGQPKKEISYADSEKAKKLTKEGKKLFDTGDYQKALKAFTEAYLLDPQAKMLAPTGQCYRQLGRYQEAIDTYALFLIKSPADHPLRPAVEQEILETKDLLAKKKREDALTAKTNGEKAFKAGDHQSALASYQSSYALDPFPELLYKVGQCYEKLNQPDDALKSYDSFLSAVSANDPLQATVEKQRLLLTLRVAQEALQAGNNERALTYFKETFRKDPKPAHLVNIGQCYQKLGRKQEALDTYKEFLKVAPADDPLRASIEEELLKAKREDALTLKANGESLFQVGDYQKALQQFQDAYSLEPVHDLLFWEGQCHRSLGHKEEALAAYRAFLEKTPPNEPLRITAEQQINALTTTPHKKPAKSLLPTTFYVGSGAIAIVGGVYAIAGFQAKKEALRLLDKNDPRLLGAVLLEETRAKHLGTVAYSAWGVSALAAATGVYLSFKNKQKLSILPTPNGVLLVVELHSKQKNK